MQQYELFVEKFKQKLTTDDCYTPEPVYDAIAGWVENEYKIKRENFIRPFYPGGDYESVDYKPDDIVVDNPPFSILSPIVRFYLRNGIKFFLFAPNKTIMHYAQFPVCIIGVNADITYENGAVVPTFFITNLEETGIRVAPKFSELINEADKKARKTRRLPKYIYPPEALTFAILMKLARAGIELKIPRDEYIPVAGLDCQKERNED